MQILLKIELLLPQNFRHLQPDNFQYIDLRFGNKVFVNEELERDVGTSTEGISEEVNQE